MTLRSAERVPKTGPMILRQENSKYIFRPRRKRGRHESSPTSLVPSFTFTILRAVICRSLSLTSRVRSARATPPVEVMYGCAMDPGFSWGNLGGISDSLAWDEEPP